MKNGRFDVDGDGLRTASEGGSRHGGRQVWSSAMQCHAYAHVTTTLVFGTRRCAQDNSRISEVASESQFIGAPVKFIVRLSV